MIFQSPDLLDAVRANRCVTTVYMTAGDAGRDGPYWQDREAGTNAAYAQMANVPNEWRSSQTVLRDRAIMTYTLASDPRIKQLFVRLPDGGMEGGGFAANRFESLGKLWRHQIEVVHPVDGRNSFTSDDVHELLLGLMQLLKPNVIRTQNYRGCFGDGEDHDDHYATAYFTFAAQEQMTLPHTVVGYQGYNTKQLQSNVSDESLTVKERAYFSYANHDEMVCNSIEDCRGNSYEMWLMRQYAVNDAGTCGLGVAESPDGSGQG